MGVYDARNYGRVLAERFDRVRRSVQSQHEQGIEDVRTEAIRLVSGGISSAELADMGHPYAINHGGKAYRGKDAISRVTVNPLPINVQTGQLRASLRIFRRQSGTETYFQLQFTSPHARVLRPGGMMHMTDRRFWETLQAFARPILFQRVRSGVRDAQRG